MLKKCLFVRHYAAASVCEPVALDKSEQRPERIFQGTPDRTSDETSKKHVTVKTVRADLNP